MKKKTFIVQLLDSKKPSRTSFTQVEDALFYSNDTDASLVFIPHEDTFDFQSAKVVMYNRGDESLVERDAVVTTEDGRKVASYELPAEIISHWGDWTAQPVFISDGEIYSGSIVPFSVFRYLMHDRPPRLNEVVTITNFIQQSQALVDAMAQEESQRKTQEQTRQSAETVRVQAESERSGWFETTKPKVEESITKADQSAIESSEALTKSQNALNVANGIDAKATNALSLSKSADTLSKSVQEQFNQVVIDGDSSVEAAQARVDASGQTNPTLKARLDKEHNEVTAQLDATATNVKMFGAKGDGITDDTDAFNLAITNTPTGGVLMVPEGTYMINGDDDIGIGINKPMSLVFNNGAILKKIPTNVTRYAIIHIKSTEKVTIEGQGILIGDRDEHIGTTGEWGTGIKVLESKDVIIRDITLKDFWGDGIYVYGPGPLSIGPYGGYSRNILIDNVTVDNVRRNGMSILDCIGVTIRNCRVTNTNGTMPNAGIDVEPNYRIADQIIIEGCYFSGNTVQDIVGGGGKGVRRISITNCEFDSNSVSVNIKGTPSEPIENVSITNCTIMTGNTAFGLGNVNTLSISNISLSIDPTKIENNQFSAFSLRENITNATIDNVKFLSPFYIILNVLKNRNINLNISIRNCSVNGVGFDVIRGAESVSTLTFQGNTFKNCATINANAITTSVQNNTFQNSRLSLSQVYGASVIGNNFYGDSPTLAQFIRGRFLEDSEIMGNTFKYTGTHANFYVIQAPENTYTDTEGVVHTRSKPNVILNNAMVGDVNNILLNPIDISQWNYTKP